MADNSGSTWGFMIFIFALGAWYKYEHANEVPVYFAYCNARENAVCVEESSSNKAMYKVSFENQIVVTWSDLNAPEALEHCVVADVKNWRCHSPDGVFTDTFAMADGEYSRTGSLYGPDMYAIGVWKWRWIEARQMAMTYLNRKIK